MKLQSITKGNFNLEQTKKTFKHENNLRFHFEEDGRFYEYAVSFRILPILNWQVSRDFSKFSQRLLFSFVDFIMSKVRREN